MWNALSQRVESTISVEAAVWAAILKTRRRHACHHSIAFGEDDPPLPFSDNSLPRRRGGRALCMLFPAGAARYAKPQCLLKLTRRGNSRERNCRRHIQTELLRRDRRQSSKRLFRRCSKTFRPS